MTTSYWRCNRSAWSHMFSSTPPVRATAIAARSARVALGLASPATGYKATPAGAMLAAGATIPISYPRATRIGARLSKCVSTPPASPEPIGPTGGATIKMRQECKLSYKPNPPPRASWLDWGGPLRTNPVLYNSKVGTEAALQLAVERLARVRRRNRQNHRRPGRRRGRRADLPAGRAGMCCWKACRAWARPRCCAPWRARCT